MATMSYCAIENTHIDMGSALDQMEKFNNGDNLNEYERRHMGGLMNACIEYIDQYITACEDGRADTKGIKFDELRSLLARAEDLDSDVEVELEDSEDEDEE